MIKRNPIHRVDPESGRILQTYRDVGLAAKETKVEAVELLKAAREGKVLRWHKWVEDDEMLCLELSDGRRMFVRQVEVSPEDAERLYRGGMPQRPRVVGVKVVFPAWDLQDRPEL